MGSLEQVRHHRRVTSISDDVWSLITLAHEELQTDMACCTATHATGGQAARAGVAHSSRTRLFGTKVSSASAMSRELWRSLAGSTSVGHYN